MASPRLTDQLDEYRPSSTEQHKVPFNARPKDGLEEISVTERRLFDRVQANPEDVRALQDYGLFLMSINQRDAGIRYLDRAIQLAAPTSEDGIVLGMARVDVFRGSAVRAQQILMKLLGNPALMRNLSPRALPHRRVLLHGHFLSLSGIRQRSTIAVSLGRPRLRTLIMSIGRTRPGMWLVCKGVTLSRKVGVAVLPTDRSSDQNCLSMPAFPGSKILYFQTRRRSALALGIAA